MTAPRNDDMGLLLEALSNMSEDTRSQTSSINGLAQAFKDNANQRERSEKVFKRLFYVVIASTVILICLALTNFSLINKTSDTAESVKETNELLFGCFQPDTQCSNRNAQQQAEVLGLIRETQFVVAICQRQFPVDVDPEGTALIQCVQSYYPGFHLPEQVAPKPTVSEGN